MNNLLLFFRRCDACMYSNSRLDYDHGLIVECMGWLINELQFYLLEPLRIREELE